MFTARALTIVQNFLLNYYNETFSNKTTAITNHNVTNKNKIENILSEINNTINAEVNINEKLDYKVSLKYRYSF